MRIANVIHISYYTRTFLKYLLFLLPVAGLFLIYQHQITIGDNVIINPVYPGYKWWVILAVYLIFISLSGVIIFTGLSILSSYRWNRREKLIPRLTGVMVNMITDYLYADKYKTEENKDAFNKKIKRFAIRKLHIEVLFLSITKIQETVAINHSDDFKTLLQKTGLSNYIEYFLYSHKLSDRILAMRIVSYLRIRNNAYEKQIYRYSESENFAQRTESYGAIIRMMEGENELAEFIGSKYGLSMIDINVIVNAVLKNGKMNINYLDFLSSNLNRKIIIGLMLAKYRYRKGSKSLILILNYIGNEDPLLNRLAWDSFLSIVAKDEATEIIIERFNKEPEEIQLLIIKNSYGIKSNRLYDLLKEAIKDGSLLVKIEALKLLLEEKFEAVKEFANSTDPNIQLALQEVTDLNINN